MVRILVVSSLKLKMIARKVTIKMPAHTTFKQPSPGLHIRMFSALKICFTYDSTLIRIEHLPSISE